MTRTKQSKIENPKYNIKSNHENDTLAHKHPEGFSTWLPKTKMAMLRMRSILAKQTNIKIIVPR